MFRSPLRAGGGPSDSAGSYPTAGSEAAQPHRNARVRPTERPGPPSAPRATFDGAVELRETLSPRDHRIFLGALDEEKLGFGERMIAKAVKAPDDDFLDRDAIGTWIEGIAAELG
jgi:hypothetical protein